MKAGRIHYFGPPHAILIDEIPCPTPEEGTYGDFTLQAEMICSSHRRLPAPLPAWRGR